MQKALFGAQNETLTVNKNHNTYLKIVKMKQLVSMLFIYDHTMKHGSHGIDMIKIIVLRKRVICSR